MPVMRRRSRDLTSRTPQPYGRFFHRNEATGETTRGSDHVDLLGPGYREVCLDENHGRPPYRTGGPLAVVRVTYPYAVAGNVVTHGGTPASGAGLNAIYKEIGRSPRSGDLWRRSYSGGLVIHPPGNYTVASESIADPNDWRPGVNENNLQDLGARGWEKLRPKPDGADVFQSLVEIREIPRMIRPLANGYHRLWDDLVRQNVRRPREVDFLTRLRDQQIPKRLSDSFVEANFGWRPFVNDVTKVVDTTIFYNQILNGNIEKNGKWQQRRFLEDDQITQTVLFEQTTQGLNTQTWTSPSLGSFANYARIKIYREEFTRIWYDGKFRYYYPEYVKIPPSQLGALVRVQRALRMYGLRVSPTLLWKVTPWTWLADWLGGFGSNIQMVEDQLSGNVLAEYMYLMRETFARIRYSLALRFNDGISTSLSAIREVRVRRREGQQSNFGFSANPAGLNSMQVAILAALGIGRMSR